MSLALFAGGGDKPVAAMARSALSMLAASMEGPVGEAGAAAGGSAGVAGGDGFFTGQTLQQFREASCHPAAAIPLGGWRCVYSSQDSSLASPLPACTALARATVNGVPYHARGLMGQAYASVRQSCVFVARQWCEAC